MTNRFLFWFCLSSSAALLLACGSKKTSNTMTSEDGGVVTTGDLDQLNKDLMDAQKSIDSVNKATMDLSNKLMDAQKSIDGINSDVSDLTKRVTALENPMPQSCSVTASCIPDGIDLVQMGVADLVKAACEYEVGCCSSDELIYKFGPGITSVDDCTQTFVDLVNAGYSPSFLSENGPIVRSVIDLAQAYNTSKVKLQLDSKAVTACVAELKKRECNKYVEVTPTTPAHCTAVAYMAGTPAPCDVDVLIKGLQKEGEECGSLPDTLPSGCEDGLVCNRSDESGKGICVKPLKEGDRCTSNGQCDPETLFCNASTGKCQKLAAEGQSCAFVDATFKNSVVGAPTSSSALSVKCAQGLQCDPASQKCVQVCSDGAYCSAQGDGLDCPDGKICNVSENPDLLKTFSLGVCRDAIAEGDPCEHTGASADVIASQCQSGRCKPDAVTQKYACAAALKKPGDACATPGPESLCDMPFCGKDSKCATACDATKGYACPTGFYCESSEHTMPPDVTRYACEPLIANSNGCGSPLASSTDSACKSGYCEYTTNLCTAKVAKDAPCASGRDAECPSGQYCSDSSGNCTDIVAENGDCSADGSSSCGADSICAADTKCHTLGKFPDGLDCSDDSECLNGWCANSSCKSPLADAANCDTSDATKNRCVSGDFCKYADGSTTGKCAARGSAGQACDPRFNGADCLNHSYPTSNGSCSLRSDTFMCDGNSTAQDAVLCQGH